MIRINSTGILAVLALEFMLAACADVTQASQDIATKVQGLVKGENPFKSLSPIAKKLGPYDSSLPFSRQFPRIAVTVLKAPPAHNTLMMAMEGATYPNACYKLTARIWKSAASFEDTPEFQWCSPHDIAYGVPLDSYTRWSFKGMLDGSTGMKRTLGPLPPDYPYPTDIKHKIFYGSAGTVSLDYWMMDSVAYEAGVEPSGEDHRLWFVEFKGATN